MSKKHNTCKSCLFRKSHIYIPWENFMNCKCSSRPMYRYHCVHWRAFPETPKGIFAFCWSRESLGSIVTVLLAGWPRNRGSVRDRGRDFSLDHAGSVSDRGKCYLKYKSIVLLEVSRDEIGENTNSLAPEDPGPYCVPLLHMGIYGRPDITPSDATVPSRGNFTGHSKRWWFTVAVYTGKIWILLWRLHSI
jgi:hypothetical protein